MICETEYTGVAVVGTGFGCLTHVRALRAAGFDVRALVGRAPDRTRQRAAAFEVPVATTSLAEALGLPGVDAVTIATPPDTHAPIAREAIAAGKHVLCEKPFTADALEARSVLKAAEDAGVVHLLGSEFRWSPGQALMARMVGSGAIGVPKHVTILLHIPLLADPAAEVPPWWTRPASGGGWLGAHVPHVIDQVRVMLGEITAVSALLPRIVDRPWDVEDAYSVQFRLASGATGLIQSTAADWGPFLLTSRVLGTEGTIWAEGDTVRVATGAGTRTVEMPADLAVAPPSPPPADQLHTAYDMLHSTGLDMGPWIRMAETFRALIEHRPVPADPPPATFHDGVASMEVLDAIRRSAASGAWASVS